MPRAVLAALALLTACDSADDCPAGSVFSPHFGQCIGQIAPEPEPTTPAPTTPTPAPTITTPTGDTAAD